MRYKDRLSNGGFPRPSVPKTSPRAAKQKNTNDQRSPAPALSSLSLRQVQSSLELLQRGVLCNHHPRLRHASCSHVDELPRRLTKNVYTHPLEELRTTADKLRNVLDCLVAAEPTRSVGRSLKGLLLELLARQTGARHEDDGRVPCNRPTLHLDATNVFVQQRQKPVEGHVSRTQVVQNDNLFLLVAVEPRKSGTDEARTLQRMHRHVRLPRSRRPCKPKHHWFALHKVQGSTTLKQRIHTVLVATVQLWLCVHEPAHRLVSLKRCLEVSTLPRNRQLAKLAKTAVLLTVRRRLGRRAAHCLPMPLRTSQLFDALQSRALSELHEDLKVLQTTFANLVTNNEI